jgi:hypothetical protein
MAAVVAPHHPTPALLAGEKCCPFLTFSVLMYGGSAAHFFLAPDKWFLVTFAFSASPNFTFFIYKDDKQLLVLASRPKPLEGALRTQSG